MELGGAWRERQTLGPAAGPFLNLSYGKRDTPTGKEATERGSNLGGSESFSSGHDPSRRTWQAGEVGSLSKATRTRLIWGGGKSSSSQGDGYRGW